MKSPMHQPKIGIESIKIKLNHLSTKTIGMYSVQETDLIIKIKAFQRTL